MIFVTVGTSEPFDRLLRALDGLGASEQLVVQYGESTVRPEGATCIRYLPYEELVAHVRAARLVVTHAGVGTIMATLANGKRPVVVPRLRAYGEAVDDHQLALARRLAQEGLVRLVEDPRLLADAIRDERASPGAHATFGGRLAAELREELAHAVGLRLAQAAAER
jgi:UDP-N-acetylglucosamine transferase subunit ALG13